MAVAVSKPMPGHGKQTLGCSYLLCRNRQLDFDLPDVLLKLADLLAAGQNDCMERRGDAFARQCFGDAGKDMAGALGDHDTQLA